MMKPNKLQLNDEQKKSVSFARTGKNADEYGETPYTRAQRSVRFALPSANAMSAMPPEESQKISDNYGKVYASNTRERSTFKRANTSIATLEKHQKQVNYSMDYGVSGDAIARVKSGTPAKYMHGLLPDPDKK